MRFEWDRNASRASGAQFLGTIPYPGKAQEAAVTSKLFKSIYPISFDSSRSICKDLKSTLAVTIPLQLILTLALIAFLWLDARL